MQSGLISNQEIEASSKIQKAYRAYLVRKLWPVLIPTELYQTRNKFLTSRLTKSDVFYKSLAGTATFIATLKAGNYQLLEYYLQHGKDFNKYLYDAYFCKQSISEDLLDTIADINHAASELTQSKMPGTNVHIFPLINGNTLTTATVTTLLPFLRKVYPLMEGDIPVLLNQLYTIPNGENFFATIDLAENIRLDVLIIALKLAYDKTQLNDYMGAITTIHKHNTLFCHIRNPASQILTSIANSVVMTDVFKLSCRYNINDLQHLLRKACKKLLTHHPRLQQVSLASSLYLQLINANVTLCTHVPSPNIHAVSQIILPPKIMEICHLLVYSKNNLVNRLTGFGIFSPKCFSSATQAHSRIINAYSKRVNFVHLAHNSLAGPWSMRIHDIEHWVRMNAIPVELRTGIIEWTYMLTRVTGFSLAKLSYTLYDMDCVAFEYVHATNPIKTNLILNIQKLIAYYTSIIKGYNDLRVQFLDYHLVLIYELLKNPDWMTRAFAHCKSSNPSKYLDYFLIKLSEPFGLETIHYEDIRDLFHPNKSTTDNIFYHLIWEANLKNKLSTIFIRIFNECELPLTNLYQWQRNNGLKIKMGQLDFFVREITDVHAVQLLNILLTSTDSNFNAKLNNTIRDIINHYDIKTTTEHQLITQLGNLVSIPKTIYRSIKSSLSLFKRSTAPLINQQSTTSVSLRN